MRVIPREIEKKLEKLGLTYHERQALYINDQRGDSPPAWLCDRIARQIGSHGLVQAWAVLKGDKVLHDVMRSNLRSSSMDNLPTPLLTEIA